MLDFKKEYKDLYQPFTKPSIVTVPKMRFLAISGKGNPNDEGECVQIMHIGPYDDEPASVAKMHEFAEAKGYKPDFGKRQHHEIYLSDPRRCDPSKLKTVIRHPVVRK